MRNTYRKIKVTAGRFLRDGHGGATTIVAVGVTVMTLGGAALIIDHNHLVAQRDILKSAADAASMAATLELNQLPDTLTEDQVRDRVLAAAHKYGVLNVLGNIADPDLTADDVEVTFDIDRGLRIVSSLIEARTGSTLASGWLYGYFGPGAISVRSGVEAVETTVELVLAIDLSESMRRNLDGDSVGYTHPDSRLSIVKSAARQMVEILQPEETSNIAVSILPWDFGVRLTPDARATWLDNGWVEYPRSRHYAASYECQPRYLCSNTSQDNDLPATPPEVWGGCVDEHRVTDGHADLAPEAEWFDHPGDKAFAQMFFPARYSRAYRCLTDPAPIMLFRQFCYGPNTDRVSRVIDDLAPQHRCESKQELLPLTADRTTVLDHIDNLDPSGGGTNSTLGLFWGQRLLSSEWRDVWGDDVHPADGGRSVRKAIVLLTDGEDTHCGEHDPDCSETDLGFERSSVCEAVKAAGTEIFVVAAMSPKHVTGYFGRALIDCSSQGERPGTYAFISNEDPETLRRSFVKIAEQLRSVRRIY